MLLDAHDQGLWQACEIGCNLQRLERGTGEQRNSNSSIGTQKTATFKISSI
jgi:hypothetical protein